MAEAADPVVIVSAARTPLGRFMGELSPLAAHKLGSHVINAALERAKLAPEKVDDFEELLRPYGIVELQRTGRVALPRLERTAPRLRQVRGVS